METEATVEIQKEPCVAVAESDWAEAEWFLEWLRLARRDYQGEPPRLPKSRLAA
jgi:hypothetical protein